ncbi:MAG: glycosyltransferase [Elusimicrobiales bacterium]
MKFTLIIPARNSAPLLAKLLPAALAQSRPPEEILVLDTCSEDGTAQTARGFGARVIEVPVAEFDHGGTRTLSGRAASHPLLLYMTDDAFPASPDCFEKLLAAFDDPACGAAYGRQLPKENASPLAAHLRLFNYPPQSCARSYGDRAKYGIKTAFLSNSFCAYDKAALEAAGWFRGNLIIAEDMRAGLELLLLGRTLRYQADACVYHSHNYSARQDFSRYFDIGVMHAREKTLLRELRGAGGEGLRYATSAAAYLWPRAWLYPLLLWRTCVKLLGYRLGMAHRALPLRLNRRLSMHPRWWDKNR